MPIHSTKSYNSIAGKHWQFKISYWFWCQPKFIRRVARNNGEVEFFVEFQTSSEIRILYTEFMFCVQTIYFTAISRLIQYYFADQLSLSDSDSSKSSLRNSGIDGMIEVEIADGLEVGFKRQVIGVARILLIRLEMNDCK